MLYLYDGEGRRVAKVSNPTFSCTPATGYTLLETYLLGPSGEHITELGQAGTFLRSNVYANGQLLATYTNNKTYFALNDWLGSKRVVTNYDGTVAQMCMNLPFGDELICSANDLSEHHFTGKIHDQESGNDYFNARYYSNSTGRFLSPDYSDSGSAPDPVPYADYTNPQSLNLYAYVHNNPLTLLDLSGHACDDDQGTITSDFSLDEGGGTTVETVDVSGQCYSTTAYLTQVQFNTQNPQTKAPTPAPNIQILPCFVKGAATGLATGLVVAGATAALATVASPAVVTGALLAAGAYGGYRLYQSVKGDLASGNNAGLAYSAGSFLGGAVAGGTTSFGVRYSITGETNLPTGIVDFLGLNKLTNPFRAGNSVSGNIGAALGKGPDLLGGGAAIAGAGAGIPRKGC